VKGCKKSEERKNGRTDERILSLDSYIKTLKGDKVRFSKEDEDKIKELQKLLEEEKAKLFQLRGY